MNSNITPKPNPDFIAEQFDDEILLYNKTGAQAVYLNPPAHTVWLLCNENLTTGEIIEFLQQQYPEQREQIREDVVSALEMLQENKVIELVNE